MKHLFLVFAVLIGLVSLTSCNPKNQPEIIYIHDTVRITPVTEDSYYVKYAYKQRLEVGCSGEVDITYTTADGTKRNLTTLAGGDTIIVGPVKKGFKANINITFTRTFIGLVSCSISVSKNDGDYVLKKSYTTPNDRYTSGEVSFIIGD